MARAQRQRSKDSATVTYHLTESYYSFHGCCFIFRISLIRNHFSVFFLLTEMFMHE